MKYDLNVWNLAWTEHLSDNELYLYNFIKVGYNAEGESLMPLVVHNGCVSDYLLGVYTNKLCFFQNKDGEIDFDCIGTMLNNIYK